MYVVYKLELPDKSFERIKTTKSQKLTIAIILLNSKIASVINIVHGYARTATYVVPYNA